jgi:hypothetical protein
MLMKMEPSQVKDKFGPLFSQRLLTMVDASKGVAEIIETCAVKVTIGVDDTDNKEGGATWVTALRRARSRRRCPACRRSRRSGPTRRRCTRTKPCS